MTDEEFSQIMILSHELRGVEFKGPGSSTDRRLLAQVTKAVLGMANRRDGGTIVIGIDDSGGELNQVGVDEKDIRSWNYDIVADRIAVYADPSVTFEVEIRNYNGVRFVVFQVDEFDDIPVLCKRSYGNVLREGACYVRTRRKPETTEIPSQADMRDLLDLAVEKGVRSFLSQAHRAGLISQSIVTPQATDQERFDEQLGDLK